MVLARIKEPNSSEFRAIYEQSGISMPLRDYVRLITPIITGAFIMTLALATAFPLGVSGSGALRILAGNIILSLTTSAVTALALLYYPLYRRNQLRKKVDTGLVYTVGYMSVLSTSGISVERVMERVSQVEPNPPIRRLANKFMVDVNLLGFDVSSALDDIARRSPSTTLSRLFKSVRNAALTSGSLKSLLEYELGRLLQSKMQDLKKLIGTLTYLGEMYVTFLVVAPILFILMLSILSVMGTSNIGVSTVTLLNVLVFFGFPTMAAGFALMLDAALGGEE
jgi:flagellar protein FlaJ